MHQQQRSSLHSSLHSGADSGVASSASSTTHLVGAGHPPPPLHHPHHHNVLHSSSVHHHPPPSMRHHELRRPDSVITTSSVVSSISDGASTDVASTIGEGDSDCPPNVYTISGLYGGHQQQSRKAAAGVSTTDGGPKSIGGGGGLETVISKAPPLEKELNHDQYKNKIPSQQQQQQQLAVGSSSPGTVRAPSPAVSSASSGHRRQASHPGGNLDAVFGAIIPGRKAPLQSGLNAGGTAPSGVCASCLPTRGVTRDLLLQHQQHQAQVGVAGHQGHRRSNSYGHHRALTATCSLGSAAGGGPNAAVAAAAAAANSSAGFEALCHHRRTGSSVLETLQTLACSAGAGGAGVDHCRCGARLMTREETIAHFLEQLKKEQAEK